MPRSIRLPQLPWHGPRWVDFGLPDGWVVETCNIAGHDRPPMSDAQIEAAINSPIGSPRLRDVARGKSEVVVLFDDMTRPTRVARIVPFILDELASAGIGDSSVRFIVAASCHGALTRIDFAKKLGEAVLARFPVYNHNPYENCTFVGTTSYGTRVLINSEVMDCDLKIAIGSTYPHLLVTYGGGGKMLLPGVAHIDAIHANHLLGTKGQGSRVKGQGAHIHANHLLGAEFSAKSTSQTNPARVEIDEAARMVGLDFLVDNLVNCTGDSVAMYAGALEPAHTACVEEASAHYLAPKARDKDIVIANAFAKASESVIGLNTAVSLKDAGGDLVLIANAPEGQVVHYLIGSFGRGLGNRLGMRFPVPPKVRRLIVYSEYPDLAGTGPFDDPSRVVMLDNWDRVIEVLRESYGDNAAVAVYPSADIHYLG
ncbi:MAG: DUF2088 domain-containing protein [Chloroflexi bacterium]|nr:DUF2088 domain-containing protein [Chloroflexota bacterium]